MLRSGRAIVRDHRALNGLHHGNEAQEDVAGGEQRRQRVGGAVRTAFRRPRIDQPFSEIQPRHATGSRC